MIPTILVAFGGALGSVARFKLAGWFVQSHPDWRFPVGTFVVNVVGCLAIGVLAGLTERAHFFSSDTRVFLFTGLLGGFTTFSAFGLETFNLIRRGEPLVAAGYVGLSVMVGLLALWLGFMAAGPTPR
jgi:fluoride exporter